MWKDIIQDSRQERKMKEEGQHLGRLFHEGWNTLGAALKMEMKIYIMQGKHMELLNIALINVDSHQTILFIQSNTELCMAICLSLDHS